MQILCTDTQFDQTVSSFGHFTFKFEMNQGLQGKSKAQRQGDFKDNFSVAMTFNTH